jgi:hypothetical protein
MTDVSLLKCVSVLENKVIQLIFGWSLLNQELHLMKLILKVQIQGSSNYKSSLSLHSQNI